MWTSGLDNSAHTHTRPVHDNRDSNRGLPVDTNDESQGTAPAKQGPAVYRLTPYVSILEARVRNSRLGVTANRT